MGRSSACFSGGMEVEEVGEVFCVFYWWYGGRRLERSSACFSGGMEVVEVEKVFCRF